DFEGSNGNLRRLCEFGNQWVRTPDGKWTELTECHFTHDSTGGKDRRDYGAGVTKEGRFFLSNGGFVADAPMEPVLRRPTGNAPGNIELPK
ncbi:MAG: DUF3472 domain-containing protein, partial [Acidobacteriota bacterium]|nr:DUF3472 domain-containing protein [Acidobacteriota bacterium]